LYNILGRVVLPTVASCVHSRLGYHTNNRYLVPMHEQRILTRLLPLFRREATQAQEHGLKTGFIRRFSASEDRQTADGDQRQQPALFLTVCLFSFENENENSSPPSIDCLLNIPCSEQQTTGLPQTRQGYCKQLWPWAQEVRIWYSLLAKLYFIERGMGYVSLQFGGRPEMTRSGLRCTNACVKPRSWAGGGGGGLGRRGCFPNGSLGRREYWEVRAKLLWWPALS
jgi:hypothetical protein